MAQLVLYNSLTKKKEVFLPQNDKEIKMYVCGPTVYDRMHIGNARTQIIFDILYRVLINLYGKNHVLYVQNITDIDDKIIDRAKKNNVSATQLTQETIKYFLEDIQYLNCLEPTHRPKATQYVQNIIDFIKILIEKKHAYIANGSVYFNVKSDPNYKILDKKSSEIIVQKSTLGEKLNSEDFALWKKGKSYEEKENLFESPWSLGRPGWHIECSSMIYAILGHTIDIHGGGIDLKFPHHTNEISQSSCALPTKSLAKYWVHSEMLKINSHKMSKSINNIISVNQLIKENLHPAVFRIFILNSHYKSQINYSDESIKDAQKKFNYILSAVSIAKLTYKKFFSEQVETPLPEEFKNYLLNNLNTHLCLEFILYKAKEIHKNNDIDKNAQEMLVCANFLGLINPHSHFNHKYHIQPTEIEALINQRQKAKKEKNWKLADKIRSDLLKKRVILTDKKDGSTQWNLKY